MRKYIPRLSAVLGTATGATAVLATFLYPHKAGMNTALAGLSLVLFLVFFVVYFDAFKQFSRKRSTRMGLNSVVMACSFLFILVLGNLITGHYPLRADWSSTARFSLAPQTSDIVRRLDQVLHVTVFSQENTPAFKKAFELLESYRYVSPNVVFSVVDLDREPLLAKEHGVSRYNMVLVKGETSEVVAEGTDEQTITNAIITVTRKVRRKVLFISGHGEWDAAGEGRNGMSKAAAALAALGYQVKGITLSGVEAVPGDTDVVVIAGPRGPFSAGDVKKLGKFQSHGGGKVLALLDPGYDSALITGKAGIGVGTGVIADPASHLGGYSEVFPLITTYPESPVTRDFRLNTVYPEAAPLLLTKKASYEYMTIVQAPPTSRLVRQGRVVDSAGNYLVAVAAGSKNGRDILMVFGDSDFASNGSYLLEGNGNLFLNCVNWLSGEAGLISIAPPKEDFVPLYLTPGQSAGLFFVSLVLVPAAVFISGVAIWWKRRRL